MDVSEVVRRVGLAYWPLIVGLTLLGAVGGAGLHYGDAPVYTSDVRFVLDAPDPQAAAESVSIADTAKSIATSPSHVAVAMAAAGVRRDVTRFAMQNIELQPLGTSGVMDLQVKDTDRTAAAVIANALAEDVIYTRAEVERTQAQSLLGALGDEISATNADITKVDAEIAAFRPYADPSVSAATLSGLYSERASLAQERTTLEAEQYQVNQYLATRPQAGIIEPAVPAAQADPSRAPIDAALGGLGGLVLALMLASVLAVVRPRFAGAQQIEQAVQVPVLGDFDPADEDIDSTIGARIRIVAARAGWKQVQLACVDSSPEAQNLLGILAARLEGATLPHSMAVPVPLNGNGQAIARPKRRAPQSSVNVNRFDVSDFSRNVGGSESALVLVTPDVLHKHELEGAAYLIELTGLSVAGVITYSKQALHRVGVHRRHSALIPLNTEHEVISQFTYRAGLK